MEKEIEKVTIEEIRFIKNQLWKVCYYGIITYTGLFTVINIFKDQIVGDLSWLGMYYYTLILLTASISLKIVNKLYHNIFEFRNYFNIKYSKSKLNHNKSAKFSHPDNEQFIGIIFILFLGYILSITYVFTKYGFNRGLYLSMITYLGLEGLIIYHGSKNVRLVMEDIRLNIALIFTLYLVYFVSKNETILMKFSQFLNKLL